MHPVTYVAVVVGMATPLVVATVGHGPSIVWPFGKKHSWLGGNVVLVTGIVDTGTEVCGVGSWIGHGPPPTTMTVVPSARTQVVSAGKVLAMVVKGGLVVGADTVSGALVGEVAVIGGSLGGVTKIGSSELVSPASRMPCTAAEAGEMLLEST
ncbi:hypothetical protein BC835DRAFT_1317392 [Cytidiella melzeri]|nr:hypothetical protein BC835DRAFT_1317392 [Cytidiella melzeri]